MKLKQNWRAVWCALGLLAACVAHAADSAAPPPSAPAKDSASALEKLVAPIALYPDPLIATLLPAAVYPLEIVQAARFVKDTFLVNQQGRVYQKNLGPDTAKAAETLKEYAPDKTWSLSAD